MNAIEFLESNQKIVKFYASEISDVKLYSYDSTKNSEFRIERTEDLDWNDFTFEVRFDFWVEFQSRHEADVNNHEIRFRWDSSDVKVEILSVYKWDDFGDELIQYFPDAIEREKIEEYFANNIEVE